MRKSNDFYDIKTNEKYVFYNIIARENIFFI
jgi:hypothetical protein